MPIKYIVTLLLAVLTQLSACTSTPTNTAISRAEVNSFAEIQSALSQLGERHSAEQILVVLDIDNTILTSSIDLGGDIWYQWQSGQLDLKPTDAQKVTCLYEDSIGLLYTLNPMNLTETIIPATVEKWQQTNHAVVALTSRAPSHRYATERELKSNGVYFIPSALKDTTGNPLIFREKLNRELSFSNGIMMTSGMNKGEMLSHLLTKSGRHFTAILFADDSLKNIENVFSKFEHNEELEAVILHYTRVERARAKEHGAVITLQQTQDMTTQWITLLRAINQVFPTRESSQYCYSSSTSS